MAFPDRNSSWSLPRIITLAFVVVIAIIGLLSVGSLVEWNDAGHILVIQYPGGGMMVGTEPGPYSQWWGTPTTYKKRDQLDFHCPEKKDAVDESFRIVFNEGGGGRICGTIAWEMPTGREQVLTLHTKYRSHEAIEKQLVRPVIAKAVTLTGPLMSSTESYAARKGDLLAYLEDQIDGGVYKTESRQVRAKDAMGVEKTITEVSIIKSDKGLILRQDKSPLEDFGIKTFNLALTAIVYDQTVTNQIRQQQEAIAKVQTAIAQAKEAEQQALTVEQQGRAQAAEAKWKQEVIKAKEVTEAQMRRDVAALDAEAAALTKRQQILLGEGEAARRQLVMTADGALEKKLEAYIKTQMVWAEAFKGFQGQLVPQVVTGGSGVGGNAALDFMNLMGVKAARDLSVDLGTSQTKKQ